MIATASAIVWVWGVTTATRRPSRMMWIAVGELEHVRHVVADQDHRQAALADAEDEVEHLPRLLHAERGGRLVHDHEPPRPRRGAGDGDALSLAAGEVLDRPAPIDWTPIFSSAKLRAASRRMPPLSSIRSPLPRGPRRLRSRPRKMFVAMSSAGATARSW